MDIQRMQKDDKVILALSGRLDALTAPQLQKTLISEFDTAKTVILDFAELAYVSSAGLRVLLTGAKTAKSKGAAQTLVNVSSTIMEIFEMTGLSGVLHVE